MKKILTVLLICVLCCSLLAFTACGDKDKHTHSYGNWEITVQATCEESGERQKTCSCGDVVKETIPVLGHNVVNGICTDCGKSVG